MFEKINHGTLIDNRYLIQKFLGQGGFGRTYLASDMQRFGEACVLKEFISRNTKAEIIQKNRVFFEREARILYKIEHPQIPKFKAWFTENKRLFIVQEFIDGKTYSEILEEHLSKNHYSFSEAEVHDFLLEMLPVLDYIHGQSIIHRDISLDNIIFSEQQAKPVLIDFGIVKEEITQFFDDNSHKHSRVGKFGYSSPEQLSTGYCYPCSDLYALGVCAVVLLTGKMPFMLISQSLEWQWESYIKVSDSLTKILRKMLAEKPKERYQSVQEILAELQPASINLNNSLTTTKTKKLNNYQVDYEPHTVVQKNSENATLLQGVRDRGKTINQLEKQKNIISINKKFVEYCDKELTCCIGPFASILIKHTLKYNPGIKSEELIEVLTEAIPQQKRAKEFKYRLHNYLDNNSNILKTSIQSDTTLIQQSTTFSVKFIEYCRRELTSYIGPFASILIDEILNNNSEFTPEELIESIIIEIPDCEMAQKFRKRMQEFY